MLSLSGSGYMVRQDFPKRRESGIHVKTYSPDGAKAIAVHDVASNCLTSAYKQNKNNYHILKL